MLNSDVQGRWQGVTDIKMSHVLLNKYTNKKAKAKPINREELAVKPIEFANHILETTFCFILQLYTLLDSQLSASDTSFKRVSQGCVA